MTDMSEEISSCRPKEGAHRAHAWRPRGLLPPPATADQHALPLAYLKARRALLAKMRRRQAAVFSCAGCDGRCCTARHNRMRVTPLEAVHIARYLTRIFRRTPAARAATEDRIQESIERFSLKKTEAPQAYTCPFFRAADHVCTLPATVKPIGCLAFNPNLEGNCAMDPLFFLPAHQAAKAARAGPAWPIPVAVLAELARQTPNANYQ